MDQWLSMYYNGVITKMELIYQLAKRDKAEVLAWIDKTQGDFEEISAALVRELDEKHIPKREFTIGSYVN